MSKKREHNSISNEPKEPNCDVQLFMELMDMGFNRLAVAEAIKLKLEKEAAIEFILSLGDLTHLEAEENEWIYRDGRNWVGYINSKGIPQGVRQRRKMIMEKLITVNDNLINIVLKYFSWFDIKELLSISSDLPKLEKILLKRVFSKFNTKFVGYCVGYCSQQLTINRGSCKGYINEIFVSDDNFVHVVLEPLETLSNVQSKLDINDHSEIERVVHSNGQALVLTLNATYYLNFALKNWLVVKESSIIMPSSSLNSITTGTNPIILGDFIVYLSFIKHCVVLHSVRQCDRTSIKEFPIPDELQQACGIYSIIATRNHLEEKKFVIVKHIESKIKLLEGTLTNDCTNLSWNRFPDFPSGNSIIEDMSYYNSGIDASNIEKRFSGKIVVFNVGSNLYVMDYVTTFISGERKIANTMKTYRLNLNEKIWSVGPDFPGSLQNPIVLTDTSNQSIRAVIIDSWNVHLTAITFNIWIFLIFSHLLK